MTRQTRNRAAARPRQSPIETPRARAPEPATGPWLDEPFTAYLAASGCEADLLRELGPDSLSVFERLLVAKGPPRPAVWAANVWLEPRPIKIASIGDAVKQLRAIQRNWALLPVAHHRRAGLIEEQLPKVSAKPLVFGEPAPTAPLGSWTLLAPDLVLASPRCSSPFRNGEAVFVEDKAGPPNRAYLKLWEAFTLLGAAPKPGETCLDLGASPGGWTWVLQKLGATVIAVDKAPLEPAIAALPGVTVRQQSAFALEPAEVGRIDWLLSDVICYPERLLRLVRRWLDAGFTGRCLCTLKFQAETDFAAIAAFAAIPNSRLMHLSHNKHELTWFRG
jgi:23S rRNA (cytidine2498-2'-O)-methyltransferase